MTLLAHGGKIAADVTKGGRSRLRAKGARNLLLNFDHTKIPLRLIVRKRDGAGRTAARRCLSSDRSAPARRESRCRADY